MSGRNAVLVVAGLVLLMVFPGGLAAGAGPVPGDTLRLGLREAVSRGLAVNEAVESARMRREVAEAQVKDAWASALPQLSLSLNYNRTLASVFDDLRGIQFPGMGNGEEGENPFGALPFGRPNTWIGGLQFSQLLYSGGRVAAALEIAENVRTAALLELREVESELTHEVRSAYLGAVLAAELVVIAEEAYRLAGVHLEQVASFRLQGTASEFDLLSAQVERDNLEPGLVDARNALRLAELNLKRLLHIPADREVSLTTPLQAEIGPVDTLALRAALSRRAVVGILEEQVDLRLNVVQLARAARLPQLSLVGNMGFQNFPDGLIPFEESWRRDWTVGLSMSVPLFTGRRIEAGVERSRAELRQAELQREEVVRGLELELSAALAAFEGARAQIDARRSTVGQAQRALELAELRFQTGLTTQLEISTVRLRLQQARVHEAQALYTYLSALSRLERVTGGAVPLLAARLSTSASKE